MSFDVPADAYLSFMGRWSGPLAGLFLDSADVRVTGQVLDVGCGPGVLTAVLVDRYGAPAVAAVDPSASFVAATVERFPGMDVRQGVAAGVFLGLDREGGHSVGPLEVTVPLTIGSNVRGRPVV